MMAWLRGMITTPRLVTRSHAVAHTSEVGDAAKANTHVPCKASAPAITARRPTASLTPLRAVVVVKLYGVLVAGHRHIVHSRGGDRQPRPGLIVRRRHLGRHEVEIVRAVVVGLVGDVLDADLVAGAGGVIHGLGHVDVVVALVVGASVLAVRAQGGYPLTAIVLKNNG